MQSARLEPRVLQLLLEALQLSLQLVDRPPLFRHPCLPVRWEYVRRLTNQAIRRESSLGPIPLDGPGSFSVQLGTPSRVSDSRSCQILPHRLGSVEAWVAACHQSSAP